MYELRSQSINLYQRKVKNSFSLLRLVFVNLVLGWNILSIGVVCNISSVYVGMVEDEFPPYPKLIFMLNSCLEVVFYEWGSLEMDSYYF
ncbi:unnamed protein product [Trifolium pratense]|uniref:Uncharacterized protein n=1 Tax=Trifolium pratense TaxID=57577 RepID=A0ACB0KXF9_TRIPR|nr:unnamed protein product [Trifolium pratense]